MAQIGILHGNKESFPQAVLEGLNDYRKGCCSFMCVDALHQQELERWGWEAPVILDLFSGQMPYLKEALRLLAGDPDRVILNEPRLSWMHSRATLRAIASSLGLKTAASLLLPACSTPSGFPEKGYINLRFPLAWQEILAAVGPYPYLQAVSFDRQPGVVIEDLGALLRRYNETGVALQELVAAPESTEAYRVFAIGATRFVRSLEPLTLQLTDACPPDSGTQTRLIEAANKVLAQVPWTICSIDFGLSGRKIEYLDANPDPYLEWWVLGERDFVSATHGAVEVLKIYVS